MKLFAVVDRLLQGVLRIARALLGLALFGGAMLLAVVLVLPIPLGNMLPALAISMLALGILERDGFWILAGLAVAAVSAAVVSGVVFAAFKAAVYFVTKVLP